MSKFKYAFRRIRGKIIPVKISTNYAPDDLEKIEHIRKAKKALKDIKKNESSKSKNFKGVFYRIAKNQIKETGNDISRRISKLKKRVKK